MAVSYATLSAPARLRLGATVEHWYFLDNLRVLATAIVIAHHVGQAYGPTGGWWPIQEAARAAILGPFFTVNRSFGMSLFFLVSGYLTVLSCDRHGPGALVRSRLTRLGIPLVVFMLVMMVVTRFLGAPPGSGMPFGLADPNAMHLWFVEHLILFSLAYAGLCALLARHARLQAGADRLSARLETVPGAAAIVLFACALAVVSAVVRIWSPIDLWLNLLGFFRVAFADVPRDLSFFVIGMLAYRHRWLDQLNPGTARRWLALGLFLAAPCYLALLFGLNLFDLNYVALGLPYTLWESLLCCGMCFGLLVIFRDRLNVQTRLSAELGRSQYLAYILHIFVVVGLQAAILALPAPPLLKFVLVSAAAIPLTFLVSSALRRPLRM